MSRNQAKAAASAGDPVENIVGPRPKAVWTVLANVALLLIVIAVAVPLFQGMSTPYMARPKWFGIVFGLGAALLLVARIFSPYKGCVERVTRLHRIEVWSAIFFCVATFFLFYSEYSSRDWLAFTMAGGCLQIFTSIMIPHALNRAIRVARKQQKPTDDKD